MSFTDRTLTCRDCGAQFTFTAGEQEFFAQKGFENEPTRCPSCRRARKAARNEAAGESYGSTGGYSGGYNAGSSYGRAERVQYETVCSNCGRQTTVPFVPRGDRPVYCADCFSQQRSAGGGRSRSSYNDRY